MRKSNREITDVNELLEVMKHCDVCRLALNDNEYPYILPLNFGLEVLDGNIKLYFHSAMEGYKWEVIARDNRASFEMDCEHKLIEAKLACLYGFYFKSITGNGVASIVEDMEEKKIALSLLMKHQTGKDFTFEDKHAKAVTVFKVEVTNFSAKEYK